MQNKNPLPDNIQVPLSIKTTAEEPVIAKKNTPQRNPKTPLPADWKPNSDQIDYVYKARPDLVPYLPLIIDSFIEYFTSGTAAAPLKRNWSMAWKRWIRTSTINDYRPIDATKNPWQNDGAPGTGRVVH